MDQTLLWAVDVVAVSVLTLGLYFPRHRRRDLVIAYLSVNVGVLVVATALAGGTVTAGLGLGLFGVLSIIRLRSKELSQHEVAYYFAALALGLVAGIGSASGWSVIVGSVLIVSVMAVADHPRLFARYRTETILLDRAILDRTALVEHLERLLGGRVHSASVRKLDMVDDSTLVEVCYVASDARSAAAAGRLTTSEAS